MTWRIVGPERNMPPEQFQRRLTELGGLTKYDSPRFRIWWSQYGYGDGSYRAGGTWSVGEAYRSGYRDLLRGSNEPCWTLGMWHDAIEYGSPESYYVQNLDEETGLQQMGGYPYAGRVEVLFNLRWHERVGNRLEFHTMPLSTWTFDLVVPIIVKALELSAEKRIAACEEARRLDEEEKEHAIERKLRDNATPFTGAVSYGRQGIRSTAIDKKMIELQREWTNLSNAAKKFRKGLQIG